MKRTLTLLFAIISVSASAQEIENVPDTTKVTSHDFNFGVKRNLIDFNSPLFLLGEAEIKQEQMSKIDPNHIRSITILKDSTAVAKYGDRGKFGVVVIEMKNPTFNRKEISGPEKQQ